MTTHRNAAITSLMYLVRSLLATPEKQRHHVGAGAKPWCHLLEHLTRNLQRDLRPVVLPLMWLLLEQPDTLTTEQRNIIGLAARRLLEFGWESSDRDLVRAGIRAVSQTYDASPSGSAALLRRILEPLRLASHGFQELPQLTRDLQPIIRSDPTFVEEVYRAAIGFRETNDESTPIGGSSGILPMRSNRRQDYEMGLHALGVLFPRFMEAAPVHATGAVIAAVEAKVGEIATVPLDAMTGDPIRIGEEMARLACDGSHIWDAGHRYRNDLELQLLDGFEKEICRLAKADPNSEVLALVLARVIRENRFAAVWRRVIRAAMREPASLGIRVWTLALSPSILFGPDTLELIGEYLKVIYPTLDPNKREAIERVILSFQPGDDSPKHIVESYRNRLLGCLGFANVITSEAKAVLHEIEAAGGPPENTPLFEMGEVTREEFTETKWLEEQGVDMEAERNSELHRLAKPIAEFRNQFLNDAPTPEQASAILPTIRNLHAALKRGDEVDSRVLDSGWTHLAGASAAFARADWLQGDMETASLIRSILLEAARHEQPRPDPGRDQHYEQHGSLSPTPRWHAADGLMSLARFSVFADTNVIGAIRVLSEDPCAEVRSAIARKIGYLYRTDKDTFWQVFSRIASTEDVRRIVHFALCGVRHLVRLHPQEMIRIAHDVFHRFRDDRNASEVRCECLSILMGACSGNDEPFADDLIRMVVENMAGFTDEAIHLVRNAADALTLGPTEPSDPRYDRLRMAAFAFLHGMARAVREWTQKLIGEIENKPESERPNYAAAHVDAARRIAHELALRTYFASGAFDTKMGRDDQRRRMTSAQKVRFLREATPLITLLTEFGFPDAVHNALETLSAYVDIDPRGVFIAAAQAVRNGQTADYQFEDLAVNLVVGLVRQYIADYRHLLRDDLECRNALIDVLSIFVRVGWTEALSLTSRLEDIFR